MDLQIFLIQVLNSVQYGLLLFLVASGLTLIFGIMGVINLAHGSVFALMVGVVGLVYGAQGVTQTAERALARVWNTPPIDLPGFVPRLVRSVTGLLIIGTPWPLLPDE